MRRNKKTVLLGLILPLLLTGCRFEYDPEYIRNELIHQLTEPEDIVEPFIGFSQEDVQDPDNLLLQLEPEELEDYVSEYSRYNCYHYFDTLSPSERLIYRAYEYALDHGYPYIWFDNRLTEDLQYTGFDILQLFALDSPLVEQNISQTSTVYTVTHSVYEIQTAVESYTSVHIDHFTPERLKNKQAAIMEARRIMIGVSEDWTQREKAEYFYDFLGEAIRYETDIPGEEYLYTALCQDRTNCDGYTNAFALLCSLAQIPCIEINSDTPREEEGHTWNAVFLEGKWVHVDTTGAPDDVYSECENRCQTRIYFGFSDALLEEEIQYAPLVPDCPEGLSPVLHLSSNAVPDFDRRLKEAFSENDRKFAIVLVDQGDLEDCITDELVNELNFDLYYLYYPTAEGKTVYYFFNDSD